MFKWQPAIEHGGNLAAASQSYGIPLEQWLDLSTGINPYAYPVDRFSANVFEQLPYQTDAFQNAVLAYYGNHEFLAGNGSQQFISLLPTLLPDLPALLPELGYQEHHRYWHINGNAIVHYPALNLEQAVSAIDIALEHNPAQHLIVINPNNPSGLMFSVEQLLLWAGRLSNGATLVVDEAFVDAQPQYSMLKQPLPDNVIVLRSFGKFFGLAGVRLGFAFSHPDHTVAKKLQQWLGPWNVNGVAQALAQKALADADWQKINRERLMRMEGEAGELFQPLIQSFNGECCNEHPLFSSYVLEKETVEKLYHRFCEQGVLLRKIDYNHQHSVLRVGRYSLDQHDRIKRAVAEVVTY